MSRLSEVRCRTQVLVFQNSFASTHDTLQVHCKSGNEDLGVHFVKFTDFVYVIRFVDNTTTGTYWNCLIQHGPKMEYFQNFRAYTSDPSGPCCQHTWIAKEDVFNPAILIVQS
ncbi:hypothetical protein Bca52824_002776 [Brassica carinata]|uniref:S-protein homolog n=1 Tax=Brassica carinata TaxID=52824 RepID=A0A8X7WLB9_BRACI|nr:hypothetical protein Bca52824_002776 [Brassica carinata]